jgi:hypothetical protein
VQETSYGVLRPPLGSVRLTVIELVAVLLRTGSEEAEAAIIASGIVREILAVFLRFPFNSILHHQVCCLHLCLTVTRQVLHCQENTYSWYLGWSWSARRVHGCGSLQSRVTSGATGRGQAASVIY